MLRMLSMLSTGTLDSVPSGASAEVAKRGVDGSCLVVLGHATQNPLIGVSG